MDGPFDARARRRPHARALVLALTSWASGCADPIAPTWVLPEHALAYGLRSEVVAGGAFEEQLAPVPADRRRIDALPGDTLELTIFAADREHVLAPEELDAAYYICGSCAATLRDERLDLPCDGTVETLVRGCLVARGGRPRITLPDDGTAAMQAAALSGGLVAFAIAGVPDVGDTDACIDAARTRPFGDLGDCTLVQQSLSLGPVWVIDAAMRGIEDLDDLPPELPLQLFLQPPNFAPEVEYFTIAIDDAIAPSIVEAGDTIDVWPGQSVTLDTVTDRRDAQRSILAIEDGEPRRFVEHVGSRWFTNAVLPGTEFSFDGDIAFVVPEPPLELPLRIDAMLRDGNGGVAWGSLHLRVSDG